MSQNTSPSQVSISYTIPEMPVIHINECKDDANNLLNCPDNMQNFESSVNSERDLCKILIKENEQNKQSHKITENINSYSVDVHVNECYACENNEHNMKREQKIVEGKERQQELYQKNSEGLLSHDQDKKESLKRKEDFYRDYQAPGKLKEQEQEKLESNFLCLSTADSLLTTHNRVRENVVNCGEGNDLSKDDSLCRTKPFLEMMMPTHNSNNCITEKELHENDIHVLNNDDDKNINKKCLKVFNKSDEKLDVNEISFSCLSEHNYSFAETPLSPASITVNCTHTDEYSRETNSGNCTNLFQTNVEETANTEKLRRVPSIFLEATKFDEHMPVHYFDNDPYTQRCEYQNREVALDNSTSKENWEYSQVSEESAPTQSEEGNLESSRISKVFSMWCENSTSTNSTPKSEGKHVIAEKERTSELFSSYLLELTERLRCTSDITPPLEKENIKSLEAIQKKDEKNVKEQIVEEEGQENNLKGDVDIAQDNVDGEEFDRNMTRDGNRNAASNGSFKFKEPTERANFFVERARLLNMLDCTSIFLPTSVTDINESFVETNCASSKSTNLSSEKESTDESSKRQQSRLPSPPPLTSLYCANDTLRKWSETNFAENNESLSNAVNGAVTSSISTINTTIYDSSKPAVFSADVLYNQNLSLCGKNKNFPSQDNSKSHNFVSSSSYGSAVSADCTSLLLPPDVEHIRELVNKSTENVKDIKNNNCKENEKSEKEKESKSKAIFSSIEVCQMAADNQRTVTTLVTKVRTKNGMMRVLRGSWSNDVSLDSKMILPTLPEAANIKSHDHLSRVTSSASLQTRQISLSPTPYSMLSCEPLIPVNSSQDKTTSSPVKVNVNTNVNDNIDFNDHNFLVKNVLYRKKSFEQSLSLPSVEERGANTMKEKKANNKSNNAATTNTATTITTTTTSNKSHHDNTFVKKNNSGTCHEYGNTGMMWRLLSFKKQDDGPMQENIIITGKGQVGVTAVKNLHDITPNKTGKHRKDKIKYDSNDDNEINKIKRVSDHKKKKKNKKKTRTKIGGNINKNNKATSNNNKSDAEMSELELLSKQETCKINVKEKTNRNVVNIESKNYTKNTNDFTVNANIHVVGDRNIKTNVYDINKCSTKTKKIIDVELSKEMPLKQFCNESHNHMLSYYLRINSSLIGQNEKEVCKTSSHVCTPLECKAEIESIKNNNINMEYEKADEYKKVIEKGKPAITSRLTHYMQTSNKIENSNTCCATGTYVNAKHNDIRKKISNGEESSIKHSDEITAHTSSDNYSRKNNNNTSSQSELHLSAIEQEDELEKSVLPPLSSSYNIKKSKLPSKEPKWKCEEKIRVLSNTEVNRNKRSCATASNELMTNNCVEIQKTCKRENVQGNEFVSHGVTQRRVTNKPIKSAAEERSEYTVCRDNNSEICKSRYASTKKNHLRPLTSAQSQFQRSR